MTNSSQVAGRKMGARKKSEEETENTRDKNLVGNPHQVLEPCSRAPVSLSRFPFFPPVFFPCSFERSPNAYTKLCSKNSGGLLPSSKVLLQAWKTEESQHSGRCWVFTQRDTQIFTHFQYPSSWLGCGFLLESGLVVV